MEVTLDTLIYITVVLLLLTAAMTAFLVRAYRKNRSTAEAPTSSIKNGSAENDSAEQMPGAAVTVEARLAAISSEPIAEPRNPAAATRPETDPGMVLLMQVWQDQEGTLLVEVDGQRYRRLFEIRDGRIGRRVLETINRLLAFSKGQESKGVSEPLPTKSGPAQPVVSPPPEQVVAQRERAFIEQLQRQSETQTRRSRITADPIPFRRQSVTGGSGIVLNLAAEIDQILQARIRDSQEFRHRRIGVVNAPDGGLRFEVDNNRYDALDTIPDPEVQALIRAAISDWETRR